MCAPTLVDPLVERSLLIAIDGGGTGTRIRLKRPGSDDFYEAKSGPSSLTLGVEQAWGNICAALEQIVEQAGIGVPELEGAHVAAALAGARNTVNRSLFYNTNPYGWRPLVMTDGYAGLIGALAGNPGTVVAVGTGVAAHRMLAGGPTVSCSGWGFPAGDEGGGAWIGLNAVQYLLTRLDGRERRASQMWEPLLDLIGDEASAIESWLYPTNATRYASLAPTVIAAATAGDAIAREILYAAAGEIERTVTALDQHPAASGEPAESVVLIGGLATALHPYLSRKLRQRLHPAAGGNLDGVMLILTGMAPPEAATGGEIATGEKQS